MLDGMPGIGPVALPPRCVEDPKRKRHIGVLGKAIEAVLGLERGKRLCTSEVPPIQDMEGGEARRWGMHLDALREAMKAKTAVSCHRPSITPGTKSFCVAPVAKHFRRHVR